MKYETTIKVQARERVPDLRTILENLFFRKPELAQKAETMIYALVKKKRIPDSTWKRMQAQMGATHQEYYTIVNKLRDSGMITKQHREWIISAQFGKRFQEMSDIWGSFVRRWKAAP